MPLSGRGSVSKIDGAKCIYSKLCFAGPGAVGQYRADVSNMTATICVSEAGKELKVYDSLDALSSAPSGATIWVDLQTSDPQELTKVAAHFGLHELTIEDCLTPGHFPKIEDYGTYTFMIFRSLKSLSEIQDIWEHFAEEPEENKTDPARAAHVGHSDNEEDGRFTRKVAIYLAERFVITFRRHEISWLDAVVRQGCKIPERYLGLGTDAVAHHVVDVLVDRFLRGMGFFEAVIEKAEDNSVEDPDAFDMSHMLELKRALMWMRQVF